MDLYRLLALSEDPRGCKGRFHIRKLLECSYPPIEVRLQDNGQRETEMFFSRAGLNEYFREFVNDLLNCKCRDCDTAKQDVKDRLWVSDKRSLLHSHPWILGFMIYLGKLHYIYYWMKWDFFDSRGDLKSGIMDDNRVADKLIRDPLDRLIFKQAYLRAFFIFYPMTFEIQDNEPCPFREPSEFLRFPYLNKEPISTDGFYGVMTKVHILREHLNKKMIQLVTEKYPTSGIDAGRDRKLLFALKSVTTDPNSPLKSMERNILDMVSRIEEPASDNIITLLFAYNWKGQMHFLFPFIEMNLDHVLRQGKCPPNHSPRLGPHELLPEHWLWREMKGVCCALSVFHRKMRNPFPDKEGIVIGLHFDLKPANILVTADGKLKITDFGQSIIQLLGKGEDMALEHSPGTSRYAAPESRPTLDYGKDGENDIKVLLNYDVWSLGCIMVETLIHLLDIETLETFDRRLGDEPQAGFFTGVALKQCVNSSLETFRCMFRNGAQEHYMAAVTDLISRMLSHGTKDRPYSWDVFNELERQESSLTEQPVQRDRITPAVKAYELREGIGFKELGWHDGSSIASFADKAGITVELVHQLDGQREEPRPCRIRLFRKTSDLGPVEIAIIWAVEREGSLDVNKRRLQLASWCFAPTYLFQRETSSNARFECRLFPIMGPPGQPNSYDLAFIFEFETLQDVLMFQGTLLKKTIFPPIQASIAAMKAKKQSRWSKERLPPTFNTDTSHIQFWAEDSPKHYKLPAIISNGHRSTAASISSSTPPTRTATRTATGTVGQQIEKDFTTMVIFFQRESPVVTKLNDGHKKFSASLNSEGKPYVTIVNRRGHESFSVRQLPAQPAWKLQDLEENPHASSSILLETDYDKISKVENNNYFKLESMDIILETSEDYNRFRERTSKEWGS